MELHGDGALTMEDMPLDAITRERPGTLNWNDTADLTGEWHFFEAEAAPFSQPSVQISVDDADALGVFGGFGMDVAGDELLLYYGDIELGRHLTFDRVEGAPTPSPATVTRADLVGQWTSGDGSVLRLHRDGSFELDDVPLSAAAIDGDDVVAAAVVDLVGDWTFAELPRPLSETAGLTLSFHDVYGSEPQLFDAWGLTLNELGDGFSLVLEPAEITWTLQ